MFERVQFAGRVLAPPRPAADLALTAVDGSEFRVSQHRGAVILLFFGYTSCPDVCPTTLVEMSQVRAILGEMADRVRFVFITVDPERDTPERLGTYVGAFDPTFIALTGSAEQLAQVRRTYGAIAEKQKPRGTAAAYLMAHTASVYVIDPEGQLRLQFPWGMSVEDMVQDIKLLLRG